MIFRFFKSQWPYIKTAFFWLVWILVGSALGKWFKSEGCLPGEPIVTCLRQWQSLIAAMIALFIASVTWKYSRANLNLSANLFYATQREKIGDKYEDDIRALDRFSSEFFTCHWHVAKHLEDAINEPIKPYADRIKNLKFPSWPDTGIEHLFDTCLGEYKDHYEKAIRLRVSKPGDFNEHGIRCHGIFDFLSKTVPDAKKRRMELYNADLNRLK